MNANNSYECVECHAWCFPYAAFKEHMDKHAFDNLGDNVNHPTHYNQVPGIECQEVTKHFNFNKGNALKYIWRSEWKGNELEDLKKAIWYLEDEIKRIGNG